MSNVTAADLAGRLGLRRLTRSWRGDCPACAYPRAFSVRDGRDQTALPYCANGCRRDALDDALNRIMAGSWRPVERPQDHDIVAERERKQAAALRLWSGSEPAAGTLVDAYLQHRALPHLAGSDALRFRPDCNHPEGGKYPAMVALVVNADGNPSAVHRTFLAPDGRGKANVEPDRASLGPVWGGAVRLDPAAPEIVVGEGIESSASAGRLLGLPAWAALSAGNLAAGLELPQDVQSVVIAADNDVPICTGPRSGQRPGQEAARAAAARWRAEGRRVQVATPDREGCDFNDILRARADA